jgi:hypothetical protein
MIKHCVTMPWQHHVNSLLTLNLEHLLKCCKSMNTWRGQICDVAKLPKPWCFKNVEKFNFLFFCFWLGLLFYRLLWSGLGELVSVMERNLGYSMDIFYELCESRFWWRISAKLSREWKDMERRKLYEVGGSEGKTCFCEWGEANLLSSAN